MSLTAYLREVAEKNSLPFYSDGRSLSDRGMVARVERFSIAREYGWRKVVEFSVKVAISGTDVEDDSAFVLLEALSKDIAKDQTAGDKVSQVIFSDWNASSYDKGFVVFVSRVEFKE